MRVELNLSGRKFDKQLKAVDKKGIPYVLFVGENTKCASKFTVKDLATEVKQKLSLERVVALVKTVAEAPTIYLTLA